MKKWVAIALCLLLCGCANTDYETVWDEYTQMPAPSQAQVMLQLPQEAAQEAMSGGESDRLYFCDDYTLVYQTMTAGDLDKTLRTVTGFEREKLSVLTRSQQDCWRYDFVWSCAGEGGTQLCRGSILDDGNYHYVISVMAKEEQAGQLAESWDSIFSSFTLRIEPAPDGTEP